VCHAPYLQRELVESFAVEQSAAALAEDAVFRDQAQERSVAGRATVAGMWQAWLADGFDEAQVDVHAFVGDDTTAALEFRFRGRHRGHFMGIAPTGREVAIPMALFCGIAAGRIRRATLYYNAGTLLRQLGLAL
jgi:steroid delta-isomerase-like uncharacterized protein